MKKLLVLFLSLALVGCTAPMGEEMTEEETPAVEVEMMEEGEMEALMDEGDVMVEEEGAVVEEEATEE